MEWRIKNPAPGGAEGERWGDTHFARSLCRWLERAGDRASVDFYPQWDSNVPADVSLVLRGRHPWRPVANEGFRVLWIISHPDLVTPEECADYHLVLAGSEKHAAWLRERVKVPVSWLGQCTDTDLFHLPDDPAGERKEFVFVGNTRNTGREIVHWAIEAGLPLRIWGKGWVSRVPAQCIVGEFLENSSLPGLYRSAKVTLNDHWPDMRRWGYVNNRVFDALACGLPVISELHREMQGLFPGAVLTYATREKFYKCIQKLMFEYPRLSARAAKASEIICREHSFEARSRELVRLMHKHSGG